MTSLKKDYIKIIFVVLGIFLFIHIFQNTSKNIYTTTLKKKQEIKDNLYEPIKQKINERQQLYDIKIEIEKEEKEKERKKKDKKPLFKKPESLFNEYKIFEKPNNLFKTDYDEQDIEITPSSKVKEDILNAIQKVPLNKRANYTNSIVKDIIDQVPDHDKPILLKDIIKNIPIKQKKDLLNVIPLYIDSDKEKESEDESEEDDGKLDEIISGTDLPIDTPIGNLSNHEDYFLDYEIKNSMPSQNPRMILY